MLHLLALFFRSIAAWGYHRVTTPLKKMLKGFIMLRKSLLALVRYSICGKGLVV